MDFRRSNIIGKYYKHLCHFIFTLFGLSTIAILVSFAIVIIAYNPSQEVMATTSEDEEDEDTDSFFAQGEIDSIIYTVSGNWIANGKWVMAVSDGELTSFNTEMQWTNKTAGHTHEFTNFEVGDNIVESDDDGSISVSGEMDVGTNGITSWPDVPTEILIEKGRTITVRLDHEETDNHFGGQDQAIHGIVTLLNACDTKPGPNMQVGDCFGGGPQGQGQGQGQPDNRGGGGFNTQDNVGGGGFNPFGQ